MLSLHPFVGLSIHKVRAFQLTATLHTLELSPRQARRAGAQPCPSLCSLSDPIVAGLAMNTEGRRQVAPPEGHHSLTRIVGFRCSEMTMRKQFLLLETLSFLGIEPG